MINRLCRAWRPVAAALAAAACAACGGSPDPAHNEWTPDEIQQLTHVTDSAIALVARASHEETSAPELQAGIESLIAAVHAAETRIAHHSTDIQIEDRVDADEYAKVASCGEAGMILASEGLARLKRLDEAKLEGDETKILASQDIIYLMAQDSTRCATALAGYLETADSPAALDKMGAASGSVYAIAIAYRLAAGFGVENLIGDQIAANQAVVARLAGECTQPRRAGSNASAVNVSHRCVPHELATDALPKLRSALSLLTAKSA